MIATGTNPRQLAAIADDITVQLKKRGIRKKSEEGRKEGRWVLLDYGDFVVHLFDPESRKLYDLELLWGDARRMPWRDAE